MFLTQVIQAAKHVILVIFNFVAIILGLSVVHNENTCC